VRMLLVVGNGFLCYVFSYVLYGKHPYRTHLYKKCKASILNLFTLAKYFPYYTSHIINVLQSLHSNCHSSSRCRKPGYMFVTRKSSKSS